MLKDNTPLRRSEQLREQIEEEIVTGSLPPGTHLDETVLAERFKVSRTPIREAFMQLAAEGLIEMRPRRGAIVVELTPQRLCEMFEVMAEIEAMCGRLAARRISDAELGDLEAAHRACEEARAINDADAYYRLNGVFHRCIYAASHNRFLEEEAISLHRRLKPYRRLQLRVRNRMSRSFTEHAGIVDAILAGDGELAAERLRAHVIVQGERFADLVASLPMLGQPQPGNSPALPPAV